MLQALLGQEPAERLAGPDAAGADQDGPARRVHADNLGDNFLPLGGLVRKHPVGQVPAGCRGGSSG